MTHEENKYQTKATSSVYDMHAQGIHAHVHKIYMCYCTQTSEVENFTFFQTSRTKRKTYFMNSQYTRCTQFPLSKDLNS